MPLLNRVDYTEDEVAKIASATETVYTQLLRMQVAEPRAALQAVVCAALEADEFGGTERNDAMSFVRRKASDFNPVCCHEALEAIALIHAIKQ